MSDHIHILGICGTFMGGLALLARECGFSVTGSDRNIYPPMSTQLLSSDIPLVDGYDADQLSPATGCVVVGNALSRGQPVVEAMLNGGIPYTSGPEWLGRHILQDQWVLAVSGTHGKTSTASMLAWILEQAGLQPGFLIGGIPSNFGLSARLGGGAYFVVEADEYDSAFFDKRSKFVHYRPKTAVINNLEYDHADIFPDLAAIETQFHHLVRCIPGDGLIVRGGGEAIDRVLEKGCWTPVETVAGAGDEQCAGWTWRALSSAADALHITAPDGAEAELQWELIGSHNAANATAAIAAAHHVGVSLDISVKALASFKGVKRRLELLGKPAGVAVYDDFAHHPTAIEGTLNALRAQFEAGKLIAIIEPRSNTMRLGEHKGALAKCAEAANYALWFAPPDLQWDLGSIVTADGQEALNTTDALIERALAVATPGDSIVIMSNGGFDGLHGRLLAALEERAQS
ncbi:MAG: UDP-N-acetylmuramate--L-alanyl-gamma-D-glutamyl-meso-2,6-diaminoheptandioate ligase [Halieaceae bacterium]|nr:MAG: UDP-N-acetylmuramate--L-alanyl-gamma-D-glutamyl-meso-2,6-diaminoheptandioate ligase [Halieaceae bacterium]